MKPTEATVNFIVKGELSVSVKLTEEGFRKFHSFEEDESIEDCGKDLWEEYAEHLACEEFGDDEPIVKFAGGACGPKNSDHSYNVHDNLEDGAHFIELIEEKP